MQIILQISSSHVPAEGRASYQTWILSKVRSDVFVWRCESSRILARPNHFIVVVFSSQVNQSSISLSSRKY
jgi:hypothetical protein